MAPTLGFRSSPSSMRGRRAPRRRGRAPRPRRGRGAPCRPRPRGPGSRPRPVAGSCCATTPASGGRRGRRRPARPGRSASAWSASSRSSVASNAAWRCHGYMPRSHCRRYIAIAQPSPSFPDEPIAADVHVVEEHLAELVAARHRADGPNLDTRRVVVHEHHRQPAVARLRRAGAHAARRSAAPRVACDVQILWPLITQSSPSRTAFVRSDARSLPASGSEKPWHHASSPRSSRVEVLAREIGRVHREHRDQRLERVVRLGDRHPSRPSSSYISARWRASPPSPPSRRAIRSGPIHPRTAPPGAPVARSRYRAVRARSTDADGSPGRRGRRARLRTQRETHRGRAAVPRSRSQSPQYLTRSST